MLENWLVGRIKGIGKQQIESLLHQGRIRVNGNLAHTQTLLLKGDVVEVNRRPAMDILAEKLAWEVVYEDQYLLVINKIAGMPVHPGLGHYRGTVLNALAHHYEQSGQKGLLREAVVHRLDKDTSGLLLLAKTTAAKTALEADFRTGRIHRSYEALVWGKLAEASGMIDVPVGRVPQHSHLLAADPNGTWGKPAQTQYETMALGSHCSLLSIRPLTGRTHQIRIHFHHLGHGLVGDPRYAQAQSPHYHRLCLHATELALVHPIGGQKLLLRSEAGFIPF